MKIREAPEKMYRRKQRQAATYVQMRANPRE
jgi:hypothetical protein